MTYRDYFGLINRFDDAKTLTTGRVMFPFAPAAKN